MAKAERKAVRLSSFAQQRLFQLDPLSDSRWPPFVDGHPAASVFHTPEWLQSLVKTYGYRAVVFTFDPPGEPLTHGIVCCAVNSWLTGRHVVSLPFSDHCEPLVESPQDLDDLLGALQKQETTRWKYVEIRPRSNRAWDMESHSGFGAGDRYFLHILDLRPGLDELYRGFHEDSVRRKIRRAEREGLAYEEGRSEALLGKFYRLLLLTRRRHHLPPQPLTWFRNLLICLGGRLKIRVALKDGQPIASILTLRYKHTLVYKYGCSDARFHNLGGMALLFWKAIQEAKQAGLAEFDFGRSDVDQPGLIIFKDRWGTARSTLTYLRHPARDPHSAGARRRMRLAGRVIAHAPDGVLAMAGKLLYRHIG